MNGEAGGLVCKTIGAAFFVLNVHITPVQKLCQELSFLCILSAMSLGETVRRSVLEQRGVCTILAAGHLIVPSNRDTLFLSRLLPIHWCARSMSSSNSQSMRWLSVILHRNLIVSLPRWIFPRS